MMHPIPDSHFWDSIDMMLHFITSYKESDQPENFTEGKSLEDYLIIGLENMKKEGYEIKKVRDAK